MKQGLSAWRKGNLIKPGSNFKTLTKGILISCLDTVMGKIDDILVGLKDVQTAKTF